MQQVVSSSHVSGTVTKSKKQSSRVVKYTFFRSHLLCLDPVSATHNLCDLISLQLRWLTCQTHHIRTSSMEWLWEAHEFTVEKKIAPSHSLGVLFLIRNPFLQLNRALLWRLFWMRCAPMVGPSILVSSGIDVRAEHNNIWFSPVGGGSCVLPVSFLQERPIRYALILFHYLLLFHMMNCLY